MNAFNLADDLIEPYRAIVDLVAHNNIASNIQLTKSERRELAHVLHNACIVDGVKVNAVPSELMKTVYNFTTGWAVGSNADQINMFMVHPSAIITPISYTFAQLEPPSALSEGKWVYYEESFEDAFILNNLADALQFHITVHG